MADENSWRTTAFRQSIVTKIDEAIHKSGMNMSRNSLEMENHVFQKAKTKEEYLGFVARLILHVRELKLENMSELEVKSIAEKITSKRPPRLVKVYSRLDLAKIKDEQEKNKNNIHEYLVSAMVDD